MDDLKKILVAVDFSQSAVRAFERGCRLANRFDAELHLLHVLVSPSIGLPAPGIEFLPPSGRLENLQDEAEQQLAAFAENLAAEDLRVVRMVSEGSPGHEVVRYARQMGVDLIVMGTHGRTGLAHVLLGSVADLVIRTATCPVLTVRQKNSELHVSA